MFRAKWALGNILYSPASKPKSIRRQPISSVFSLVNLGGFFLGIILLFFVRITSYYTDLYILLKVEYPRKCTLCAGLNYTIWRLFPHCFYRFNPTAGLQPA